MAPGFGVIGMFLGSILSLVGYGLSFKSTSIHTNVQPRANKKRGYVREIAETMDPQLTPKPTPISKPVQPVPVSAIPDSVKFCPECGEKTINTVQGFCTKCGLDLKNLL